MADPYRLRHPIIRRTLVDGETREEVLHDAGSEITLRRPQARDIKIATNQAKGDIDLGIKMIARLSSLDEDEVELLDLEDFEALGELTAGGSPAGPKTGETA